MKTILIVLLFAFVTPSLSLPLSTQSRWIVDEPTEDRVKLACANWAAHLEPMLPEGLDKKPLNQIARYVALMGFNCIRLTWATYMFTRHANLTVAQSFQDLGLVEAKVGIAKNNPDILGLTVVDAQKAVVEELGSHGVMVVLDNQVSQPMWCCGDTDGNGFFGDEHFNPREWLRSLAIVAKRFKDTPMVVGMSLRNELRGPRQNKTVWYRYVRMGANTIHRTNPNLLILISGLDYDLDFRMLKERPLGLKFHHKLVFETHRYAFTEGQTDMWLHQPLNNVCANITGEIEEKVGFLTGGRNPAPLFVTEFGINQMGVNEADNLFLGCFLGYLAEKDLDWALWALQGSYYLRDGLQDPDETYGMFNSSWNSLRSPEFHEKLQLIQQKIQDPKSNVSPYYIMYHPTSGRCMRGVNNELHPTDCWSLSRWSHAGDGTPIRLMGTPLCLTAVGDGLPVSLTADCMSEQSTWKLFSDTKYQIANRDEHGTDLCLDWDPNYSSRILTKKCLCSQDDSDQCHDNPQSQWFKLISSNAN
ncbi:unnamed protein product [Ilex paraguariensis]|uniref:Glycoside hydrolase family 5 domain-containing protein n=1 Tax=Ilex paraguariensis TaxID=185542 RepID=A0ABC8TTD5_9AQUA